MVAGITVVAGIIDTMTIGTICIIDTNDFFISRSLKRIGDHESISVTMGY